MYIHKLSLVTGSIIPAAAVSAISASPGYAIAGLIVGGITVTFGGLAIHRLQPWRRRGHS